MALLPPFSLGYISVLGALLVAPVSVMVAPIGVRLAHGFTRRRLEIAFGLFLMVPPASGPSARLMGSTGLRKRGAGLETLRKTGHQRQAVRLAHHDPAADLLRCPTAADTETGGGIDLADGDAGRGGLLHAPPYSLACARRQHPGQEGEFRQQRRSAADIARLAADLALGEA
eukprot:gene9621-12868_t